MADFDTTTWATDSLTKATATTSTNNNVTLGGTLDVSGIIVEGRTVIKVPPSDFMGNDDDTSPGLAGSPSAAFIDDGGSTIGVQVGDADGELFAIVDVPLGYTATKVYVYGDDTANAVEVRTWDITDGSYSSEISNSGLTVGDDTALASNHVGSDTKMLLIEVLVTSANDIVYGAVVTIEPS
tara:strand:+ start:2399 stop:2944 length:546 start_codon:yes stop_codon:yes gene_type:complete